MDFSRAVRIGDQIQREVSQMLFEELKDPRIGMVTISKVEVTGDLRLARIFYTVYGDEAVRAETHKALTRAAGFVRRHLARVMRMRFTPEVEFKFDRNLDHVDRMNVLFHELSEKDAQRAREVSEHGLQDPSSLNVADTNDRVVASAPESNGSGEGTLRRTKNDDERPEAWDDDRDDDADLGGDEG